MLISAGEVGSRTRYCLTCYARLEIDAAGPRVLVATPQSPLAGRVTSFDGQRDIVECPDDRSLSTSFFKREGVSFAVCHVCSRLLRAAPSAAGTKPLATALEAPSP